MDMVTTKKMIEQVLKSGRIRNPIMRFGAMSKDALENSPQIRNLDYKLSNLSP